jgi:hypothetical protein
MVRPRPPRRNTGARSFRQLRRFRGVINTDYVFGGQGVVTRRLRAIRDKPTAPASPWQNGFAERLIGSIRRERLDHVVVSVRRICAGPCDPLLVTTTTSEHIGHWTKMRRSLPRFSALESSVRTRYSADFIITTTGSRFSAHIGSVLTSRHARLGTPTIAAFMLCRQIAQIWGRRWIQGSASSASAAKRRSVASSPCLPTSWMPIGRLSLAIPSGTDIAGRPEMLCANMNAASDHRAK